MRLALPDLCGPVWFERNYKFTLRRLPGRGSSGSVDPMSFRPQTAQEPFPCFRASPGYDEFGDDVPPEYRFQPSAVRAGQTETFATEPP
jgi:hypothetical protein